MKQTLVEVDDGRRLMIGRAGTGSPTVVCLSAAGGAQAEWSAMVDRLSAYTAVVTYGRPSLGGSDPIPTHLAGRLQSIGWSAAQLRTLLQNAEIAAPYVLLTSSLGSWIADQYAARWPHEVTGLVLVDPTNSSQWPRIGPEAPIVDGDDESGCIRLNWASSYAEMERAVPSTQPRRVDISSSDGRWESSASPSQWHDPLTLAEVDQLWQAAQQEWVARLSALHVVADTAGHFVHRDQPDLVAHVVRAVLAAARNGAIVELSAAVVAGAGGRVRSAPL